MEKSNLNKAFKAAKETFNWKFIEILLFVAITTFPKVILSNIIVIPPITNEYLYLIIKRLPWFITSILFNYILTFLLIELHNNRINSNNIKVSNIISISLSKIPKALPLLLIVTLLEIFGFVLAIIPGIIISILFSFSYYIYYNEDSTYLESIKQSKKLVMKNKGEVVSLVILVFLIRTATQILAGRLLGMIFTFPVFSTGFVNDIANSFCIIAALHYYYMISSPDEGNEITM
jgi:hypothetical protein